MPHHNQARATIKGRTVVKKNISINVVTDTAIRALAEREGLSYSTAFGALAVNAALRDAGLKEAIQKVLAELVAERLAAGADPSTLSRDLAKEALGMNADAYMQVSWN
jgi:hypothetical protein